MKPDSPPLNHPAVRAARDHIKEESGHHYLIRVERLKAAGRRLAKVSTHKYKTKEQRQREKDEIAAYLARNPLPPGIER